MFKICFDHLCIILLLWITFLHTRMCSAQNENLKLVQVIFRHGDRNPMATFPTDPYKDESYWPEGLAQLTKRGKMQQYSLGQYLRRRYTGFLNETYSPYEILVQSSNVDRTIMSAEANLAGLYPPEDDNSLWNPSILWQPIPVHLEPVGGDKVLFFDADCPRYNEANNDFLSNSPVMKKLKEDYKHAFDLMTSEAGKPIQLPDDVFYLYDTLFIEKLYYKSWPEWAPEGSEILQAMRDLTAFNLKAGTYTEEMQRLLGGPLLGELVEHMNGKVNGKLDERRKFFMYSAHDQTVSALLNTMEVFDTQLLMYCAMAIVELWQRDDAHQSQFVKVFLRNETIREPYLLTIPNCEQECPLEKFNEMLKNKIPVDWQRECQSRKLFSVNIDTFLGVGIGLLALATLLCFSLVLSSVYIAMRKKRGGMRSSTRFPYIQVDGQDDDERM